MQIRPELPAEYDRSPFIDDGATLDRVDLAKSLSNLYANLDQSTVAILHGRWGVGKSTFIRRWCHNARNDGYTVVYFDAFSHDYISEPFDALISAIFAELEAKEGRDAEKIKNFKKSAVEVSKRLAISTAKVAVRVATAGIIDDKLISVAENAINDEVEGLTEKAVEHVLDRQAHDKAAFAIFREKLREMYDFSNLNDDDNGVNNKRKFIFVVDELDRCRPDFALKLLECLKHFFRVEGLHFILVTNKKMLKSSVTHRYGIQGDAEEYLQKFYDFIIYFERDIKYQHDHMASKHCRNTIRKIIGSNVSQDIKNDLERYASEVAFAYDLTMRDAEHLATNIALAYLALSDRTFSPPIWIVFLCFFKVRFSDTYESIKMRRCTWDQVRTVLGAGNWSDSFSIDRISTAFRYALDAHIDLSDPEFRGYSGSRYNIDRLEELPFIANSVIDSFSRT